MGFSGFNLERDFTFRREVDVTRRVDEIEEEFVAVSSSRHILGIQLEVKRKAGRFDGYTTLKLVDSSSIGESFLGRDTFLKNF